MSTSWPPAPPPAVPPEALPPQPARARIKVLHVITKFYDGAGGNTLLSVLGTDRARYEMWIAGGPGGPLWERAERNGIATVKLTRLHEDVAPVNDLRVLGDLVRLIRRERFSVVHTHSTKAGFLGRLAAWLCRTPVVVHTIHGFPSHDFMSRRLRTAYLALERLVRPMTDAFLAVAPEVAREAVERRLARPGTISVVPSAVELDRIPSRPDPSVRSELGIESGVPLVGTVGRLDFQKAPLDFVRMAARVTAARPDARFVMVGEGKLLERARAEARRLGVDITFTGFRSDAVRIASAFDVYVVSSLYEGLGRALSEALAAARPVVATSVNGVIDVVEPGSTGLLAPPADPDALARNVVWLLENPDAAQRMGEAAQMRARAIFEPRLMCALIDATYSRLLGLPDDGPGAVALPDIKPAHEFMLGSASQIASRAEQRRMRSRRAS
jgi:glycosyltransferase involved in cell wall biosynthesis